jgi:hypothetical protein
MKAQRVIEVMLCYFFNFGALYGGGQRLAQATLPPGRNLIEIV